MNYVLSSFVHMVFCCKCVLHMGFWECPVRGLCGCPKVFTWITDGVPSGCVDKNEICGDCKFALVVLHTMLLQPVFTIRFWECNPSMVHVDTLRTSHGSWKGCRAFLSSKMRTAPRWHCRMKIHTDYFTRFPVVSAFHPTGVWECPVRVQRGYPREFTWITDALPSGCVFKMRNALCWSRATTSLRAWRQPWKPCREGRGGLTAQWLSPRAFFSNAFHHTRKRSA